MASPTPTPPPETKKLRPNQIGTLHLVVFVVACAAPLTLMAGVAPVALAFGGVGAPSGYIFATVILLLFAVGYVAMSRHVRNTGAFYAFIGEGLGRPLGGGAGVGTLVAYFMFTIGQTIGCAVFAQTAIQYFTGATVPWPILAVIVAIGLGVLGYRRVTLSARLLAIALALEMIVLTILAVAVLARGGAEGITFGSFVPENFLAPGISIVLIFAFGAFLGVEATAIYSEEAKDPKRTVPRATYIAVIMLGVFYSFVCWAIVLAFGESTIADAAAADPVGLFFFAMNEYVGSWATGLMHVMLFVSIFASTLAFHNESTRYMFSLGRDGVLPRILARTHRTTGSPWIAGATQIGVVLIAIVVTVLLGADPYLQGFILLASAAVVGVIGTQLLSSLSVIVYFWRDHRGTNVWQRLIAPVLALAGLAFAFFLMVTNFEILTGVTGAVNVLLFVPIIAGFVYGIIRVLSQRSHGEEPALNLVAYDDDSERVAE